MTLLLCLLLDTFESTPLKMDNLQCHLEIFRGYITKHLRLVLEPVEFFRKSEEARSVAAGRQSFNKLNPQQSQGDQ